MAEYASHGVGTAGLTTGIIGTGLGVLNGMNGGNGLLGGLFGGNGNCGYNRYDAEKDAQIAELKTGNALRDSSIYTDGKLLELYKYIDGKLGVIDERLCAQAVHNQKTEGSFALVQQDVAATRNDLLNRIRQEKQERCCADNAIVNYANATFYPKMVADVTTGTTTTAQLLYNPIPSCGDKCCDC